MTDFTKLSDEELLAIIGSGQPQQTDVANMSNEQLMGILSQQSQSSQSPVWGMAGSVPAEAYASGERNVLGNVFERPGAMSREAIRQNPLAFFAGPLAGIVSVGNQKVQQAGINPAISPTFQQEMIDKFTPAGGFIPTEGKGLGGSLAMGVNTILNSLVGAPGMAEDIITSPADVLLMLAPKIPIGAQKTLGEAVFKTKAAQEVGRWASRERSLFFNDKWVRAQAKTIQELANGLQDVTNKAFDGIYKPFANAGVDPTKIDDVLLKYNIDPGVIQEIEDTCGKVINTVGKTKLAVDILRKRVPYSMWKGGATPGGLTNTKLGAKSASGALKEVIYDSLKNVDPNASVALQAIDDFATANLYPKIQKLSSMVGGRKVVEPNTKSMVSTWMGGSEVAGSKEILRNVPKTIKELGNMGQLRAYLAKGYREDLNEVYRTSKKVLDAMSSFQRRSFMKKAGKAGAITAAYGYGAYSLGRGIGTVTSRGQ